MAARSSLGQLDFNNWNGSWVVLSFKQMTLTIKRLILENIDLKRPPVRYKNTKFMWLPTNSYYSYLLINADNAIILTSTFAIYLVSVRQHVNYISTYMLTDANISRGTLVWLSISTLDGSKILNQYFYFFVGCVITIWMRDDVSRFIIWKNMIPTVFMG